MQQLQLFSAAELAMMRDRSASRRYSPAREEFRREHARHRVRGLAQRHAAKLRRLRGDCGGGGLAGASGSEHGAVRPVPVAASRGPAQVATMQGADTAEPAAVSSEAAGDSAVAAVSSGAAGDSVVAAGESVVLSVGPVLVASGPVVVASGSTVVAVGPAVSAVAASGSAVAAGGHWVSRRRLRPLLPPIRDGRWWRRMKLLMTMFFERVRIATVDRA
ncbi:hypothetical protein COUCH_23635 [Couchioplanes caeruleus]|uniref:hypothetical protein n=1 Tax=Couchioplanes caeruleus TaxID=56438 RepID=UPI0020BDB707|nr:hypothetical protein [Couchioplanes caeruleus]UQU68787.1 hypothetical protein COUCH_23635 [Couchioplanes caeruleus]